jgi:glucose/arabinose dehydrogenase
VTSAHAATLLPTGFTDQLIANGLSLPTAFAFLPDGRVLVTEQLTGNIRLIVGGTTVAAPVATVSALTTGDERGLLSIAVDPGWPARPYVYVHHTQTGDVIRVLRFTAAGDLANPASTNLTLGSPYTVIGGLRDNAFNHNGGTLRFGNDGMLYLSLGDDASGCPAQDSTRLVGCILRLKVNNLPAGAGGPPLRSLLEPTDNPFIASPNSDAHLVWAYGLRNPFRIQIDRGSTGVLVADVGEGTWEELDLIHAGDNGGWPFREGPGDLGWSGCSEPSGSGRYAAPIDAYGHDEGLAIIAAGIYRKAFNSPQWPASWDGNAFYADFYGGFLRMLHLGPNGWARATAAGQPDPSYWATGLAQPVDFAWGPDGQLWWLSMWNGELRRISAVSALGVPPAAPERLALSAAPNPGNGALTLSYDLPRAGHVRLAVYDLSGRRIAALIDGTRPAGSDRVRWSGAGDAGRALPAGVYLARLELDGAAVTRRIVLTPLR